MTAARTNGGHGAGVPRRIAVVTAGLSQPSSTRLLADRLAESVRRQLSAQLGGEAVDVEVVELREHAQALAGNLLTGFPGPGLRSAIDLVLEADGLVVVTPVFNASYSGLFKMFFDVVEQGSLSGTPVLMAATGGTARHSLALEHAMRPLFAYLHAVTVPTAVFAATDDWGSRGDAHGGLVERIDRASGELARLVAAAPPAARTERVDPFETPTSFEDLLAGR
ncbi:FMN reductase [Nocardioides sp. WL0053]|uniref:FMN reductase n=1 Tax=Nocardioides jiangsuensis TaxID=2866161 RepID=A0ABS7RI33_9ACTN|nr:FMN reductase [Nocardioides jiangsuensis]MBY9074705.1 FMN reductase [Nocardioides jiangsuensis]